MAESNFTNRTSATHNPKSATHAPQVNPVSDDLREVIATAFAVRAMLQGAMALIEDPGAYDDPHGDVWAAREIIEAAWQKVEEIYSKAGDLELYERIEALEGGAMSATTLEADRIAGALKGLDALRQLERSAEKISHGATAFYAQRLTNTRALVAALGPMTPEQEGAVAVLAEYIHSEIDGVVHDISPGNWVPLSAMTEDERQAMVDRIEAENAIEDAVGSARVISLAHRVASKTSAI
jgi:hypothetical protein